MSARTAQILRALFGLYVACTVLHIAYVVYHEPFAFDAWNVAVDTGAEPPSITRFFDFWHQQYTSSNPRIGQPLAYLAYKTTGFAELLTPLAYLAIVAGGFVLAVGRRPRLADGRDLATLAIGIGFLWFAAPNFPAYMFCRAYATNYVWMAAVQIWFLAALRTHDPQRAYGVPALAGIFLVGIVAGMGNEHVGPTLILIVLALVAISWRRRRLQDRFLYVAALGLVVGYLLIFFAPGQAQRYDGLGERYTLLQQIAVRGVRGNLDIMQGFLTAAAPLLVLLVFVVATGIVLEKRDEHALGEVRRDQRDALAMVGFALLAGALITCTVFASPKLGPRFYMHAMFGLLAGVMAVARSFLHRNRSFAPFVILAVLASGYAAARTIPMFTRVKRDSDQRLAELAATPRGGVYTAQAWEQVDESWWILGDDVRDQKKRELVANYFALDRVLFRGGDMWATLGVTDVKLIMQYQFEPELCIDEIEKLDIQPYLGRDMTALHHTFLDIVATLQKRVAARLRSIDLVVTFLGNDPPLPNARIYAARWADGKLEGYAAKMTREGRSTQRRIELPAELRTADREIFLVAIGDPPRRLGTGAEGPFTYEPWRSGPYWALACKPDHCFVILALNHAI